MTSQITGVESGFVVEDNVLTAPVCQEAGKTLQDSRL